MWTWFKKWTTRDQERLDEVERQLRTYLERLESVERRTNQALEDFDRYERAARARERRLEKREEIEEEPEQEELFDPDPEPVTEQDRLTIARRRLRERRLS